jgi:hypothetical protein
MGEADRVAPTSFSTPHSDTITTSPGVTSKSAAKARAIAVDANIPKATRLSREAKAKTENRQRGPWMRRASQLRSSPSCDPRLPPAERLRSCLFVPVSLSQRSRCNRQLCIKLTHPVSLLLDTPRACTVAK